MTFSPRQSRALAAGTRGAGRRERQGGRGPRRIIRLGTHGLGRREEAIDRSGLQLRAELASLARRGERPYLHAIEDPAGAEIGTLDAVAGIVEDTAALVAPLLPFGAADGFVSVGADLDPILGGTRGRGARRRFGGFGGFCGIFLGAVGFGRGVGGWR